MAPGDISLRKRKDGSFEARLFVGYAMDDGKRSRIRRSFYGRTKKEAMDKARQHRDRVLMGQSAAVAPGKILVTDLVDRWMQHQAQREAHRVSTQIRYKEIKRKHIDPLLGAHRIDDLTPLAVEAAYDRIPSPRERGMAHEILRAAFNKAVKWRLLPVSPLASVDHPYKRAQKGQALSREQSQLLLGEARGRRLGAAVYLALGCGLRLGEVLALRWGSVDLKARTIFVSESVTDKPGIFEVGQTKTAASVRLVPLPSPVAEALRERRKAALLEGLAGPEQHVVCSPAGKAYRVSNFYRDFWTPLRAAVGIDCRFHDLRHTAASYLADLGIHPKTAARILGHADMRTTMQWYTHVSDDASRAAADALGGAMGVETPKKPRKKKGGLTDAE